MTKHSLRGLAAVVLTALAAVVTAQAATPGVTANSILLGQSVALSGPSRVMGTEMRDGALAYFDYINGKGGVAGRKIVLKTLDDGYEPERAAKNTRELISTDGAFALFGYVGTPTSNAALPLVEKEDLPFFAPLTGAESLREPFNKNIFTVRASYVGEMDRIVENLDAIGIKKIAVFFQNDAYGRAGLDAVERALKRRKQVVLGTATVERNTVDVDSAVKKIRALQPRAVIIVTASPASAAFIRGMRKDADSVPYFWNISFVGGHALATALGPEAPGVMISQVMPSPWDNKLAIVKEYRRLYLSKPDRQPGFVSLEGFIAAKTFVEGLQKAGANLTRASFTKAVESMGTNDLGGFVVKFAPNNHNGSDFVDLTVISSGGNFMY